MTCHEGVSQQERAGFPPVETCRACHNAPGWQAPPKIPSRRVYRLADFVFFSHARHSVAKIDCARCHGPVSKRDRLKAEVRHNMKSCMSCHRAMRATLECNACHELGQ